MNRGEMLDRALADDQVWDVIIIGGGSTGVGAAVDAASRGYRTLLVEQSDFGKATSSRSTKLIHGGVRYLKQGRLGLVIEALRERRILLENAPHLVHDLTFIVPAYQRWDRLVYGLGMKVYDLLAGRSGFSRSRVLSARQVLERIPTLTEAGLRGGVAYHDGQFDDARLLINLVQTAVEQGGTLLNYCACIGLRRDGAGRVDGVVLRDVESGREGTASARCVINATGAFAEAVVRMAEPDAAPMIAPSQGAHVVLDRTFLPGGTAIMVPRTRDGRVMFAIPWHGHTLLGTTETAIEQPTLEPRPLEEEVAFILEAAGRYLNRAPTRADVLSAFAGIRPLARAAKGAGTGTAGLSREHTLHVGESGLISIFGGKWTTYRKMAADCVDQAIRVGGLEARPCVTATLHVHGHHAEPGTFADLAFYGSDAPAVRRLIEDDPALGRPLHDELSIRPAQVVYAVRHELARTVDDVLARRTRCLQLNARAALAIAPAVAGLMAAELGEGEAWRDSQVETFNQIAQGYVLV